MVIVEMSIIQTLGKQFVSIYVNTKIENIVCTLLVKFVLYIHENHKILILKHNKVLIL